MNLQTLERKRETLTVRNKKKNKAKLKAPYYSQVHKCYRIADRQRDRFQPGTIQPVSYVLRMKKNQRYIQTNQH